MKKNKYINNVSAAILSLFAAFATTSCSESFLDHQPDERTEINSLDDVQKLLMTAYPTANYSWIAELASDNLQDNLSPHLPSNPNDKQVTTYYNYGSYDRWDDQLFKFEPATYATYGDYDSPGMLWEGYYSSIASANYALQALDAINTSNESKDIEKAKALRAEALLIRAYDHFCLVNMFSQAWKDAESSKNDIGIPYVTEPETTATKEYERGSVAEVYTKIQADLEAALPNVNDAYIGSLKYHFNKSAAQAFAARFYLYTRQWQKVIDYADNVLGTDSVTTQNMLMDYSGFGECATLDDYANVWQNPKQNNNLMLSVTHSLLMRRVFGYRYSLAGKKCQDVMMVRTGSPLWSGYICTPIAIVGGMLFGSSSHDYGFFNSKIGEQFEYTDKLAGIGYPHIVLRTFTANELLLSRAEAKTMLGDYNGATEDLMLYWNGAYNRFSEADKMAYSAYFKMLTPAILKKYYVSSQYTNCFDDWDFVTTNVSSSYVIPHDAIPYMNCINDFRRFETCFEGLRFFDLKRWGVKYMHEVGITSEQYVLDANDERRSIEVPWETISAGLESSRRTVSPDSRTSELKQDVKRFIINND